MAEAGTNPYLALLQQQDTGPTWAQVLQNIGNLGFGLAGGFSQAAATGQPTMAGIGPGLMMGNSMNVQAANAAEQDRLKRAEIGLRAQEYDDKQAERLRKEKQLNLLAGQYGPNAAAPGFNAVTPDPSLMGPNLPTPQGSGYDTKVAGAEGGTRNGGMVFNELGSGAFGPYQFMPATWAAVRAQNPGLNLPEDMTQATREQHDAAHGAFKAGNAQGLQAAGFQPTADNLYLAHRFGLGGATSVLRADPDKPLSEVLPIDWQRQNPDMRGQTAGGFRRLAAERVGGVGVPYVVRPDAKPVQYSGPVIEQGDSASNQPSAAMTPVVPQPKWETPGDVMPVNPSAWFSTPTPPAVPVPGGAPAAPPAPPAPPAPGGPNVVQPQTAPGPNTPPMAPSIVPSNITPPPVPVLPDRPRLTQADSIRLQSLVLGGHPELAQSEYNKLLQAQRSDILEQHKSNVEVWKQQQNDRQFERGQAALQWRVLDPKNAQMMLGAGYDPTKAYQINQKGEVKPVGGAQTVVNIDQKGEQEFSKEMGKMDATRFGDIIKAEGTMNDMASKLGFALSQFKQTYTGPGADAANAFYKTLGAVGFEDAAKKANAAEAAVAVVSQMKPAMRAPGAGSSSDRDMDTFAAALPSLLNLPGGNERITAYFQRMADRATRVRELAQEHSEGGQRPLSRTGFDTAVKNLGPLFTPDELKEMSALGKQKAAGPKPPLESFGPTPQMTPAPPGSLPTRPPIGSFGGGG